MRLWTSPFDSISPAKGDDVSTVKSVPHSHSATSVTASIPAVRGKSSMTDGGHSSTHAGAGTGGGGSKRSGKAGLANCNFSEGYNIIKNAPRRDGTVHSNHGKSAVTTADIVRSVEDFTDPNQLYPVLPAHVRTETWRTTFIDTSFALQV